uniref:Uncharacterized protein n=1 Tax=Arundo donax TaxID=35708 RepID=A0A0A9E1D5_ARUDO
MEVNTSPMPSTANAGACHMMLMTGAAASASASRLAPTSAAYTMPTTDSARPTPRPCSFDRPRSLPVARRATGTSTAS